ncbi:L,D-transpeptidase [Paenibacillus polymyxa]|uniref:L,D-transpeptidase n=1 Tax=Paenibacillus polymyxa TaxID=1406 RepID=UPI002ED3D1AD|nr:L,D-transpeptidase [Paenibacillus polymyxa]
MSYHIIVNLPSYGQRDNKGTLKMYNGSGSLVFGPVEALGRGDRTNQGDKNNANWRLTDADTPQGVYGASIAPAATPESSYGPYKRVAMSPISGDITETSRSGFYIHGGDPGTSGPWAPLRPTHGCIRISNANVKLLLAAISDTGGTGKVTVQNQ